MHASEVTYVDLGKPNAPQCIWPQLAAAAAVGESTYFEGRSDLMHQFPDPQTKHSKPRSRIFYFPASFGLQEGFFFPTLPLKRRLTEVQLLLPRK